MNNPFGSSTSVYEACDIYPQLCKPDQIHVLIFTYIQAHTHYLNPALYIPYIVLCSYLCGINYFRFRVQDWV